MYFRNSLLTSRFGPAFIGLVRFHFGILHLSCTSFARIIDFYNHIVIHSKQLIELVGGMLGMT